MTGFRRLPFFLDHVWRLFRYHDSRRIRVSPYDRGHDGRIHHPEPGQAIHSELRVDDSLFVVVRSHFARAYWMVYSGRVLGSHTRPVRVRAEHVCLTRLGRHIHQHRSSFVHRLRIYQICTDLHSCTDPKDFVTVSTPVKFSYWGFFQLYILLPKYLSPVDTWRLGTFFLFLSYSTFIKFIYFISLKKKIIWIFILGLKSCWYWYCIDQFILFLEQEETCFFVFMQIRVMFYFIL